MVYGTDPHRCGLTPPVVTGLVMGCEVSGDFLGLEEFSKSAQMLTCCFNICRLLHLGTLQTEAWTLSAYPNHPRASGVRAEQVLGNECLCPVLCFHPCPI